jgi:diketogulonate reductase-like aldo/keto reductase
MQFEQIGNVTIPKIGFGTWKIGGDTRSLPAQDASSLAALRSALEIGYTHFDTAELYANGHAEELLGQAIREAEIPRERLFITSKVKPVNLRYNSVLRSCEASLRRLRMDYLDLYLIHWPGSVPLDESFRALNQLVREGRVRHLGVSNFDLRLLKQAQAESESPLLANQVPLSLADREYVKNGMLAYCQQNDILLTAYSPIDDGRLQVNIALQNISAAHNATPYQIALAWLAAQPRVISIPMSADPQHQAENFAAADITLSAAEIAQLDRLG